MTYSSPRVCLPVGMLQWRGGQDGTNREEAISITKASSPDQTKTVQVKENKLAFALIEQ